MKYHVNPETGKVSACRAKVKCRFGGSSGSDNHFADKTVAEKASETMMSKKYSLEGKPRTKNDFTKVRESIKVGLISSGIIPNASALPPVSNKAEMIDRWFGGDKKKYEVVVRISDMKNTFNDSTRKSVGKFVASGLDVSVNRDNEFDNAPSVLSSDVELIDDLPGEKISMEDLASGKIKAF